MMKIGNVSLNNPPNVAVVITDQEENQEIASWGADVLEVRVDQFESLELASVEKNLSTRKALGLPMILTLRNDPAEGGTVEIAEEKKLEIFQAVISLVDAVDIELSSPLVSQVVDLAKQNQKTVIVSSHNFKTTPSAEALEALFQDAVSRGADIVKIAAQANTRDDVNTLMLFTVKHKSDQVITMSLGELGSLSRLTFPSVGSLLTYAYVRQATAPGQIPFNILQEDLRRYYPEYK